MAKLKEIKQKKIAGCKVSPSEEFIYIYDVQDLPPGADNSKKPILRTLRVYNMMNEKIVREFEGFTDETEDSFGWSYDGKYLAKKGKDVLSIYETPDMNMQMDITGKRTSIKAENIAGFKWSPSTNLIAIYKIPTENQSQPSIILVMEASTREVVYLKSTSRLESCQIEWHPNGKSLAALITYSTSADRDIKHTTIGIISIDKRSTSFIEEDTSEIGVFKWEPTDDAHFAIIRYEKDPVVKTKVTVLDIYVIAGTPQKIQRIPEATHTFPLTHLHWCPLGAFLVATRLLDPYKDKGGAFYGSQYFFYVKEGQAQLINSEVHDNAMGAGWDPSGRYYGSACCAVGIKRDEEEGYKIYNSFGEVIHSVLVPKLQLWRWRKRPMSLLDKEGVEAIKGKLSEYWGRFKQMDKEIFAKMEEEAKEEKRAKMQSFLQKYLEPKLKKYESERGEREKILGRPEFLESDYEITTHVEEVLTQEKVVKLD